MYGNFILWILNLKRKKKKKRPAEIWHDAYSSVEGVIFARKVKRDRNLSTVEELQGIGYLTFIQSNLVAKYFFWMSIFLLRRAIWLYPTSPGRNSDCQCAISRTYVSVLPESRMSSNLICHHSIMPHICHIWLDTACDSVWSSCRSLNHGRMSVWSGCLVNLGKNAAFGLNWTAF